MSRGHWLTDSPWNSLEKYRRMRMDMISSNFRKTSSWRKKRERVGYLKEFSLKISQKSDVAWETRRLQESPRKLNWMLFMGIGIGFRLITTFWIIMESSSREHWVMSWSSKWGSLPLGMSWRDLMEQSWIMNWTTFSLSTKSFTVKSSQTNQWRNIWMERDSCTSTWLITRLWQYWRTKGFHHQREHQCSEKIDERTTPPFLRAIRVKWKWLWMEARIKFSVRESKREICGKKWLGDSEKRTVRWRRVNYILIDSLCSSI